MHNLRSPHLDVPHGTRYLAETTEASTNLNFPGSGSLRVISGARTKMGFMILMTGELRAHTSYQPVDVVIDY